MVVTFDFDNTIAMSHMVFTPDGDVKYEFDGYNDDIIAKIREHIQNQDEVHIVTSRIKAKEGLFPEDTIEKHLEKLNLQGYFLPHNLHYTDSQPKLQTLRQIGSEMHWDDDVEEMISLKLSSIHYKNPYDLLPDSDIIAKVLIFDQDNKLLLLQRGDGNMLWDLPGGHLKEIEVERGNHGEDEGLEREVAEETGLILPFQKKIGQHNFNWKGKKYDIRIFMSKINQKEPDIDLNLQKFQENVDAVWVSLPQLEEFLLKSTQVLEKAVEFLPKGELFEQNEPFQRAMKKKHRKMKKRLIGLGDNKHFGGGKGHKKPSFKRSESAPPIGEAQEEPKKPKIKVKITPKLDEKRKKRRNRGSNWPYIGGGIGDFGSSKGGGNGGGE